MKPTHRLRGWSIVVVLGIFLTGCDRPMTDEDLRANVKEQIRLTKEICSVLNRVDSAESARAAKGQLETLRSKLTDQLSEVKRRGGTRTAKDLSDVLGAAYAEMLAADEQLEASYRRVVEKPELKEALGDSFELRGLRGPGEAIPVKPGS